MHVTTNHYEDFKRFVTGTGIAPSPPVPGAAPAAPAPVPGPGGAVPPPKAGPKMAGAVYSWGGTTPANGTWGAVLISAENVVSTGSLDGKVPPTFAVDFPDAIVLDGRLNIV